jgi:cbb3-type cytochrome oxidase maturation protein
MDSLFLLIPIAVVLTGLAVKALFWAVENKQYDDLDSAGYSILFDKDETVEEQQGKDDDD